MGGGAGRHEAYPWLLYRATESAVAEEINRHIREGSIVPVEITVNLSDQASDPGGGGGVEPPAPRLLLTRPSRPRRP